jgi:zinc protease
MSLREDVQMHLRVNSGNRTRKAAYVLMLPAIFPIAILIGLLLVAPALAQGGKTTSPIDDVLRATLKNGLHVVIVRNTLAPVVATMVNYLAGSNEAPAGFPGMAHAQEHMMFRGSPGLSADQLSSIMAAMGGKFNANTQQTITQYFLTVPAADLDVALHMEAIRMRGILATEKLWAQERGAIEQEVAQDLSSPDFISYTKLLAAMFKGTPYAQSPLGSVESFNKTTGAMLKKFHKTWYAPNNAVLVIVGNVEPNKALSQVKKHFGTIPRKILPKRAPIRLQPIKPETIRLTTDEPYGQAAIAFRLPGYDSPDYGACRVLAEVLSSQRGALFELVLQGKALHTEFSLDTMPHVGLGYAAAAFSRGSDAEALVKEMQKILADNLEKGFSYDLVEAAKRAGRTEAELKKNSVLGLAMAWSEALTVQGKESPEEVERLIDQVSDQDVTRVARKYLNPDDAIITILTPAGSGKPSAARSRREGGESFASAQAKPVKLPYWADKTLTRLDVPKSTINPTVTTLPNGLRLIVQPLTVSDTVSVFGSVRNKPEMETPEGKEGVDQVLDQLFSFGTTSLDRVAFQKELDDIGAQESAGSEFGLQVLSGHFERGVQLLADNLLNPALPDDAFQTVRQQTAAAVAGRNESPHYIAGRAIAAALFPKEDPSLREATPATVSGLSLDDVKDYHRTVFRPDLTTIVIMGKIAPVQAQAVVGKYFGSWKATGPAPDTFLPAVPPNAPSATDVPNQSRIQSEVTLAHTLGLTRSNPDYYALELGNHVLGGAFYATRLYRDLREETGLVYYVASTIEAGINRSVYTATFGCDPANIVKAHNIVERDLKQMQTTLVRPDELNQAKALLLREIPLFESSVHRIGLRLLSLSNHLLPLDEPIRAAGKYVALTAEDVRTAFAKWMRPKDIVRVTEGPSAK